MWKRQVLGMTCNCLQISSYSWDPMDCSLPGSSVHGILQARIPAAAAAKSLQSCLTLCDPIDSSPPGSPVPGVLQARVLEWIAIAFSAMQKSGGQLLRAPKRMKQLDQSRNDTQLWLCVVVKVKSDAVKNNITKEPGMLGPCCCCCC